MSFSIMKRFIRGITGDVSGQGLRREEHGMYPGIYVRIWLFVCLWECVAEACTQGFQMMVMRWCWILHHSSCRLAVDEEIKSPDANTNIQTGKQTKLVSYREIYYWKCLVSSSSPAFTWLTDNDLFATASCPSAAVAAQHCTSMPLKAYKQQFLIGNSQPLECCWIGVGRTAEWTALWNANSHFKFNLRGH